MKQKAAGNFSEDVLVCLTLDYILINYILNNYILYNYILNNYIFLFLIKDLVKVSISQLQANVPQILQSISAELLTQVLVTVFVSFFFVLFIHILLFFTLT
jgi:hypothetical protein